MHGEEKVFQEFVCHACLHYTHFKLSMGWNRVIKYKCRHCGREHQRYIKDGRIQEDGRYNNGDPVEELVVPASACTDKPLHTAMAKEVQKDKYKASRDAKVFEKPEDYAGFSADDVDLMRQNLLRERKMEIYGGD